jgi:hypothetical protein
MSQNKTTSHPIFVMTLAVCVGLVLGGGAANVHAQSESAAQAQAEKVAACDSTELGNTAREKFFKLGYHGGYLSFLPQSVDHEFDEDDLKEFFDIEVAITFSDTDQPKYTITHDSKRLLGESRDIYTEDLIKNSMKLAEQFSIRSDTQKRVTYRPATAKISSNENGFSVKVNFSESNTTRAKLFVDAYQYFIREALCGDLSVDDMEDLLTADTKVYSEGDQIFIVSQTSRAAIDNMFAIRKKARGES